ncbi:MAG: hypothetical protein NZ700_13055, partial [Gemmataceae bacterium]|nr:hypothetical protein [Gemmataceae bacterium]
MAELRGRLVGPRCRFSSTVEVAYPLRPARPAETVPGAVAARVVIPEPCLWDPDSPFVYMGPVELWSAGQRLAEVSVVHPLRVVRLEATEIWVNGRRFPRREAPRKRVIAEDWLNLRREGYTVL